MGAAAQCLQLARAAREICRLVEPCIAADEDLVGADDESPRSLRAATLRALASASASAQSAADRFAARNRRLTVASSISAGSTRNSTPAADSSRARVGLAEARISSSIIHRHAVGRASFMIAAAVSSIERRVTSITGQCICDKDPARLAHLGPHRLDIGIVGRAVVMQQVQPVSAQLDQPLGIVGQARRSTGASPGSAPGGNGTPGTKGTFAALMPRLAR